MNAGSLWAGHEYAWIPGRGKGELKSNSVKRVKLIKAYKYRQSGNQNATTFVEVEVLDWDGLSNPEPTIRKSIPAREIIDFWDSHWNENEEYYQKYKDNAIREAQRKRIRQAENVAILNALEERGIERDAVTLGSEWQKTVDINRDVVISWLGIDVKDKVVA